MKTFEEFVKALETDDALKAKVKEAFEGAEVKNEEARISALVKTATDNGYNASTEDFAKYQSGSQVLDEDELSLVSAGKGYCVAVNNPADYLAADKVTCKIFKEHWDEKLYAVADQYFTRRTRKAAEGEDQPAGC